MHSVNLSVTLSLFRTYYKHALLNRQIFITLLFTVLLLLMDNLSDNCPYLTCILKILILFHTQMCRDTFYVLIGKNKS